MSDLIQLEKRGHIAVLTINNPPANTWTKDSLIALTKIVNELNEDRDIFALVMTGQGEKFYSAGADLKTFADGDKARANEMAQLFGEAFSTLGRFRGVSIAAVNGYAMGGGLECAMLATSALPKSTPRWRCPRPALACYPAPVVPRTCPGW